MKTRGRKKEKEREAERVSGKAERRKRKIKEGTKGRRNEIVTVLFGVLFLVYIRVLLRQSEEGNHQ